MKTNIINLLLGRNSNSNSPLGIDRLENRSKCQGQDLDLSPKGRGDNLTVGQNQGAQYLINQSYENWQIYEQNIH